LGVCERSPTVVRPRQRRIVVSLTPSSSANSATDLPTGKVIEIIERQSDSETVTAHNPLSSR
jgi:hypothetical protein